MSRSDWPRSAWLGAVVVIVDVAILVAAHRGSLPPLAVAAYAIAACVVVVASWRMPVAGLVAALVLAALSGTGQVLLLWSAYRCGRALTSRLGSAIAAGATAGFLAAQLIVRPADIREYGQLIATCLVFVALPLLTGRYLAQNQRLLGALTERNRQLRIRRETLAEQERLRERLRIASEMHDSIGRRLGLISIQAAALEVAPLPAPQRDAVLRLADSARDAVAELHNLVGLLRGGDLGPAELATAGAIGQVVSDFRAAGIEVTFTERGQRQDLPPAAAHAAYRVVEEGLANAARHAPGRPALVRAEWEPDALLLTIVNEVGAQPNGADPRPIATGSGHGLPGLSERIAAAGGLLDHGRSDDQFRLFAMLPAMPPDTQEDGEDAVARPWRTTMAAVAAALLMLVILPTAVLVGGVPR